MGKLKENPKYNVFTFRVDDDLAEQIRETAKCYDSTSQLLQEAIREKLVSDQQHYFDDITRAQLRR